MQVVACFLVYRDADLIRPAILSVAPYVEKIVVLHGKFKGRTLELPDDGTKQIISDLNLPNLVQEDCGELSEIEFRTHFFDFMEEGDYAFMIDGDEIAYGNIREAFSTLKEDFIGVWTNEPNGTETGYHPKLIKKQKGIHYAVNHFSLFTGEGKKIEMTGKLQGMEVINLGMLRSGARQEAHLTYADFIRTKKGYEEPLRFHPIHSPVRLILESHYYSAKKEAYKMLHSFRSRADARTNQSR
jgi:hypothetical protein